MRQNSLNAVHLAIGLLCVIVMVAVILPMLGSVRGGDSRRMQNSTQLRGIHQGLVTYANSNKYFFPGLNKLGEDDKIAVEERFQLLMEDDYFTPEYAISPSEIEPIREWDHRSGDPVATSNYSYAMLQIPQAGGRRVEWSQTLNTHAIVLSDRNTGTIADPASIHSASKGPWVGSVLWNDNHVAFEYSDEFETLYGENETDVVKPNPGDRLFESPGDDDALLIHTGNEKG